jgi:hypothetical protein
MHSSGLAAVQLAAGTCSTQRACQLLDGKQLLGRLMIVRAGRFVESSHVGYNPVAEAAQATATAASSAAQATAASAGHH